MYDGMTVYTKIRLLLDKSNPSLQCLLRCNCLAIEGEYGNMG